MNRLMEWSETNAEVRGPNAEVEGENGAACPMEEREGEVPTLNSPKSGEFRMGHPSYPGHPSCLGEFDDWGERERRIYRGRTIGMLRKYMQYSMETGRLPSLLGREFFRAKVTSYTVVTFEDRVIFVHDMERCLERLDEVSREVIGRIVLQEYTHEEAARLLGYTRMTVHRNLEEGLDRLIEILLEVGLLEPLSENPKKNVVKGA